MNKSWYEFHYKKNGELRHFYLIRKWIWGIYLRRKYGKDPIDIDIRDGYYGHHIDLKKIKEKLRGRKIE